MASNGESSRQGHTYGPTTAYGQGENIYLSDEKSKIDCPETLLLQDPFIYRENLRNDKGGRADENSDFSKTFFQKKGTQLLSEASNTNRDTILEEATRESISNWNPGHSREQQTKMDDNVTLSQGDRITKDNKSGNGNISASMAPNRSKFNYSLASTQYRLPTLSMPSWRSNVSSQVARTSIAIQKHYFRLPHRLCITFNGNLTDMTKDWSQDEWAHHRRIVIFEKAQTGVDLNINFKSIPSNETPSDNICVSCIWWEEKSDYYITSIDIINLLEQLTAAPNRFTVEEKNRIRRNLEGFRPHFISKAKPSTEELFKTITAFPHPKPTRLEKDFKVLAWDVLEPALKRLIGKYSSGPKSILPTLPSYIVESEPQVSTSISDSAQEDSQYSSSIQRDHDVMVFIHKDRHDISTSSQERNTELNNVLDTLASRVDSVPLNDYVKTSLKSLHDNKSGVENCNGQMMEYSNEIATDNKTNSTDGGIESTKDNDSQTRQWIQEIAKP